MQNRFEKPRNPGIEVNGGTLPLKETIDDKQPNQEKEHKSFHTSFKSNNHLKYCGGMHNIFHRRGSSVDGSD